MSYSPAGSDALDPQVAVMPGGQNTAVRVGSSESGDIAQAATRLHLINLRYTRSSHWSRGECAPPRSPPVRLPKQQPPGFAGMDPARSSRPRSSRRKRSLQGESSRGQSEGEYKGDFRPECQQYQRKDPEKDRTRPVATVASSAEWAGKDSNLRPTDYESAALTN